MSKNKSAGPLRLALIGCGSHSRANHAEPLARYAKNNPDQIKRIVACDLDIGRARQVCDKFGFADACSDVDKMLETEELDGCVAVMPVDQIVPMATKLLQAKIPCVIEKPLGSTPEELDRLIHAARHTRTPHIVSVNRRFNPYLRRAVEWIMQHGRIHCARATMARGNRTEDSFIWSTAMHAMDTLRYVAGDVQDYDWKVVRHEDMAAAWYTVDLRFRNGSLGHLDVLPTAGRFEESYDLIAEGYRTIVSTENRKGAATLQCWEKDECVIDLRSPEGEPADVTFGPYAEVEAFVAMLRDGAESPVTVEDVAPSLRICFDIAGIRRKLAE